MPRPTKMASEATLREHYAGLAMQALVSNPNVGRHVVVVDLAVKIADQLIAQLNERTPGG